MQQWSLTLQTARGVIRQLETGETQFVVGAGEAEDILSVAGEGVSLRHAWVCIVDGAMQVEDLGGGTSVNGHPITERVEVAYPAWVQMGEVTLVVKRKSAGSQDGVIPQRGGGENAGSLEVTLPQRGQSSRGGSDALGRSDAAGSGVADYGGRYRLVREIARGGMGQIYFGEDTQLKREIAVKVSSVAEGGVDLRFSKEAEILATLAHPNIVPIHASGVDALGRPFYSMKLVKGRTLQAVLNALGKGDKAVEREYPRSALLTVFRKVCDAIAFAHAKGILHRDLKPENVMVGEFGEVLVMDWGLAKVLGEREPERQPGGTVPLKDSGDYGMTMEGEVMGTPQYMSPEQAEGMVGELDARSDVYALGAVLYAILTLRPPIDGKTLNEVLTKVKRGEISSMITKQGGKGNGVAGAPSAMGAEVPEGLQAVTLKAMATDRARRYSSVEELERDIDAYLNGFATSAESAGAWKRARLWVARNKTLSISSTVLMVVVMSFTAQVIRKGRAASEALASLKETAPTFAVRAQDALKNGEYEEALKAVTFALQLEQENADYHTLRGNVLQLLIRWPEALKEYEEAVRVGQNEVAEANLELTKQLLVQAEKEGVEKAKVTLADALNGQGRQAEAMEFLKGVGDYWKNRKKDPSVIPELVKRLEAKLLPVPGTQVRMSKTEFTIGEWKLYLRAEGMSWLQGDLLDVYKRKVKLSDEHPVVLVSWEKARAFCAWLSEKTGKEWRLPTHREWEAAVGNSLYPWGDYYPPHWDDGNYALTEKGARDMEHVGVDGIFGPAPVASFKPNALGFYDLGGNVGEWMWTGGRLTNKAEQMPIRGGSWEWFGGDERDVQSSHVVFGDKSTLLGIGGMSTGFRLVRREN